MELTPEMAARYAGGQINVQNQNGQYLHRGEIETATVHGTGDEAFFRAKLRWMAQDEGYPYNAVHWVKDTANLVYEASLSVYHVSDIGGGRTLLQSFVVGELVTLFPSDHGSSLDPSRVEGLNLE